mmetsp:Transcript_1814/g.3830  ORF Transcript_1814/g.3830 Transcript_1814/m.3830 type:complete len:227 (-) Transcript_1814:82-762(-)
MNNRAKREQQRKRPKSNMVGNQINSMNVLMNKSEARGSAAAAEPPSPREMESDRDNIEQEPDLVPDTDIDLDVFAPSELNGFVAGAAPDALSTNSEAVASTSCDAASLVSSLATVSVSAMDNQGGASIGGAQDEADWEMLSTAPSVISFESEPAFLSYKDLLHQAGSKYTMAPETQYKPPHEAESVSVTFDAALRWWEHFREEDPQCSSRHPSVTEQKVWLWKKGA